MNVECIESIMEGSTQKLKRYEPTPGDIIDAQTFSKRHSGRGLGDPNTHVSLKRKADTLSHLTGSFKFGNDRGVDHSESDSVGKPWKSHFDTPLIH